MAGSPLKLDPDAFRTPIAAALVLAPPVLIVGTPLPIIGVDLNASIGGIGISLFGAPAVAHTIQTMAADAVVAPKTKRPTVIKTALPRCFIAVSLSFQVAR